MRSIYAKILLWSLVTVAISLVAFGAVSFYVDRHHPGPWDFFHRTIALIDDEVLRAYEEGGTKNLAKFLERLNLYYGAEHYLTDAQGRDMVDSTDRSALLKEANVFPKPPRPSNGRMIFGHSLRNGRYHLLVILPDRRFDPRGILPYYAAVVLVIALLGYILAIHLAAPLRSLRLVVGRFGQGDLSARAGSTRQDEIGELSRAFDEMAGQIQTLLTAERRLLQDVSHELRSPLARLGFNLELARMSDDRDAAFGRVKKDFERLSCLVDELLDLTCAEGDPSSRREEEVRLDELLRSLVDDCSVEAEAKGCRLVLRIHDAAVLTGDQELLRRALENVLRNAIRHAPDETLIEVEFHRQEKTASISIRDYGPGVPEDALESIFDPFFRVGTDRSRSNGGVGLGLSIARRSLELHHGQVSACNALPGLRVTIDLPVAPAQVA